MNTTHTPTISQSLREIEAELNYLGESSLVDEFLICETSLRNVRQHLENIRKRLSDPVHLMIDNFGGILQDVDAFESSTQAEEHFKTATGLDYGDVRKWEDADRSYSLGLSDKFDTQIWEVTIRRSTS
jgi:hypothetical protein